MERTDSTTPASSNTLPCLSRSRVPSRTAAPPGCREKRRSRPDVLHSQAHPTGIRGLAATASAGRYSCTPELHRNYRNDCRQHPMRVLLGCTAWSAGGSRRGEASGELPRHPRPTPQPLSSPSASSQSTALHLEQEVSGREGGQDAGVRPRNRGFRRVYERSTIASLADIVPAQRGELGPGTR